MTKKIIVFLGTVVFVNALYPSLNFPVPNDQYIQNERDAFNSGVRLNNLAQVTESLEKLSVLKQTVDISDALFAVCSTIRSLSRKKGVELGAGLLCFVPGMYLLVAGPDSYSLSRPVRWYGNYITYEIDSVTTHHSIWPVVVGGVFVAASALLMWHATTGEPESKKACAILQLMLTHQSCVVVDPAKVRCVLIKQALFDIRDLLDYQTRVCVDRYLIDLNR
jgi:hypothetical protein